MITTLNAIAPIFLIIATGYLLFRTRIVDESVWSAIEHICFYLLFPFLIIRTLSRANLGSVPVFDFMAVIVVAILGMSALLILIQAFIWKRFPQSGPSFSSIFQGATRFHGFVAIAVIGPLYGDTGVTLAALALAIMVPLLNVISVVVLSVYGHSDTRPQVIAVVKKIVTNPLIIACIVGLLFNWLGVPDILFDAIDIIGAGGLGLALLAVGAGMNFGQAAQHKMLLTVGVLTRLIGMPAIVIAMSWLVGLDGIARTVAIIAGAVPTAASAYVMARKMGGNAELMSSIVTFQVFVAFFTLPLFIYIAEQL
ncbi:MAG: AEC family transporter [Gammaproteobacteria bacterium]|nr:AEC family transporter [Gammaproteobacteria bacterium]